MKKILAVIFVLTFLFLTACGAAPAAENNAGSTAPEAGASQQSGGETEAAQPSSAPEATVSEPVQEEEDGQNPVMNFIGPYVCDRCTILIECDGPHGAKASVTWSSSASELTEWSMSGIFDEETLSFKYTNGIKTNYVYGEDGIVTNTETVYKDGTGTIAFTEDLILSWVDDTEHAADGMLFSFNSGAMEQWDLN